MAHSDDNVNSFVPAVRAANFDEFIQLTRDGTFITSNVLAELFERNHRDVLRSIREQYDFDAEFSQRNFALVEYLDKKGKKRPCYRITQLGFLVLGSSFSGPKANKLRILLGTAFLAREREHARALACLEPRGIRPWAEIGRVFPKHFYELIYKLYGYPFDPAATSYMRFCGSSS